MVALPFFLLLLFVPDLNGSMKTINSDFVSLSGY
jgi:hypothetical protein